MPYAPAELTRQPLGMAMVAGRSDCFPISDALRIEGIRDTGSGAYPATGKALFFPFEVAQAAVTVKKIVWGNSSTVNGNVDVGIYDHLGDAVVRLGGTGMSGASGLQVGDITDTELSLGYYYLAFVASWSSGSTPTFGRFAPTAIVLQSCGVQEMTSGAYPLPATATLANPSSAYVPLLFMAMNSTA